MLTAIALAIGVFVAVELAYRFWRKIGFGI